MISKMNSEKYSKNWKKISEQNANDVRKKNSHEQLGSNASGASPSVTRKASDSNQYGQ